MTPNRIPQGRACSSLLPGLALPVVLTLAACGGSALPQVSPPAPGGPAAGKSCTTVAVDYTAQSLPLGMLPRPGPEALYLPAPRAPQLENTGVWQALPILVSGSSAYRCGEFLYQDWLFDDHGAAGTEDPADRQKLSSYLFSPKAGTLTYPNDPVYADNAADLVELRLRPLADATVFRLSLNSLQDLERVAFTLALGESAGAQAWPHDAGVSAPAEWFLTVHGTTAELLPAAGGAALSPAPTVTVDLERRQFEVRVAHALWNPGRNSVRIAAGVGLWDADAGSYLQAGPTNSATAPGGMALPGAALFNMAFRAQEPVPQFTVASGRTIGDAAVLSKVESRWWRDRAQADALAAGDVSAFFATVDFGKLADGIEDDSAVPRTGFLNRIMASRYVFGQGLDYVTACGGISAVRPCKGTMLGQLQPYTVYVPEKPAAASGYGLTMQPHALSANYNQYLNTRHARQLGERSTGTLVVTPSARGPDGFYYDASEANVFETWADVARHYPLDPDWVVMGGVSMGGIGTFRIAPRYPDLFARVMPIVAAAGDEALLPSLRNVPVTMWTSAFDELQPLVSTEPTITALTELGYRLDSLRFDAWDHLTPSTNDDYQPAVAFLGEARVERDPAQVTYVLMPEIDNAEVDLVADKAYWLSGLRLRDAAAGTGSIDVRSEGFGTAPAEPLAVVQGIEVLSSGNQGPSPYTHRVLDWAEPMAAPVADRLLIRASNIASVTIDPKRAKVSCKAALEIDSDGPLTVVMAGCS